MTIALAPTRLALLRTTRRVLASPAPVAVHPAVRLPAAPAPLLAATPPSRPEPPFPHPPTAAAALPPLALALSLRLPTVFLSPPEPQAWAAPAACCSVWVPLLLSSSKLSREAVLFWENLSSVDSESVELATYFVIPRDHLLYLRDLKHQAKRGFGLWKGTLVKEHCVCLNCICILHSIYWKS